MDSDCLRIPTCYRHNDMVERMVSVESTLKEIRRAIDELRTIENKLEEWWVEHTQHSQWLYGNKESIEQIVAASRWAITSKKVFAYLFGAIVSVGMTLLWLKENIHRFMG